jgi:hypothetical protein
MLITPLTRIVEREGFFDFEEAATTGWTMDHRRGAPIRWAITSLGTIQFFRKIKIALSSSVTNLARFTCAPGAPVFRAPICPARASMRSDTVAS